jgi:hypothetical protein
MKRIPMPLRAAVVALVSALAPALFSGAALANHTQESIFQDDQYLLDSPTTVVSQTLATLKTLGVQRIRVNVLWVSLAPDPLSRTRPADFVASNPASYPAAAWAPYDRLVELSAAYGINVDFTVTAPGPLWAMGAKPVTTRAANHWAPNSLDFYNFMVALGLRYSGVYTPPPYAASNDSSAESSNGGLTLPVNIPGLTGPACSRHSRAATSTGG